MNLSLTRVMRSQIRIVIKGKCLQILPMIFCFHGRQFLAQTLSSRQMISINIQIGTQQARNGQGSLTRNRVVVLPVHSHTMPPLMESHSTSQPKMTTLSDRIQLFCMFNTALFQTTPWALALNHQAQGMSLLFKQWLTENTASMCKTQKLFRKSHSLLKLWLKGVRGWK